MKWLLSIYLLFCIASSTHAIRFCGAPVPVPVPTWTVAGHADTTSAQAYIASGTNQLMLTSGSWPGWAASATVCVPGAGQSYTTNTAGSTWIASTTYNLGDLVNWNGLTLTPFNGSNSDAYFNPYDWYSVLGGSTATDLESTIVSVSGGTATLADNASTTVTSTCWYGLDDTSAFNTAIAAASAAWVSGPPNEVLVPNQGTYQVSGVCVLSHVNVVMNGITVRPTMPVTHPMFMLRNADGTLSSHCSITGNWTANFTGVQAESYSGGTWSRRMITAVYADACADWQISGCDGVDLTGGNVVEIIPTSANVNPIRGAVSNIMYSESSGPGQVGFGPVQIDGGTAITVSNITSYGLGRALNVETDNSVNGFRHADGIVASDLQEIGSGAAFTDNALALSAHGNEISDVSAYGVTGINGGSGIYLSYNAGTSASVSNFRIDTLRVTGGGQGIGIGNNDVFSTGIISNGVVDGCTLINQSNGKPVGSVLFTTGMALNNIAVTNGDNSGFMSAYFDGSQGALATGTVVMNNCSASGNGTYGFENDYAQQLTMTGCTSMTGVHQTYDLYCGSGTNTTLNSCNITQTTGSGTIITH